MLGFESISACFLMQCFAADAVAAPFPLRHVMQCVAVCCNVLQCIVVCCSVLQRVAVCCSVLQCVAVCSSM